MKIQAPPKGVWLGALSMAVVIGVCYGLAIKDTKRLPAWLADDGIERSPWATPDQHQAIGPAVPGGIRYGPPVDPPPCSPCQEKQRSQATLKAAAVAMAMVGAMSPAIPDPPLNCLFFVNLTPYNFVNEYKPQTDTYWVSGAVECQYQCPVGQENDFCCISIHWEIHVIVGHIDVGVWGGAPGMSPPSGEYTWYDETCDGFFATAPDWAHMGGLSYPNLGPGVTYELQWWQIPCNGP